jgi:hypothetical protein
LHPLHHLRGTQPQYLLHSPVDNLNRAHLHTPGLV